MGNIIVTEENTKQYAERIIREALESYDLPKYKIDHVMDLTSAYGDIRHMEGKAEGIDKAKAVYKPSPNATTYAVKDHMHDAHSQFVIPQSNQ